MTTSYKKTDDPNIIMKIETVESEIHLDKLENQISELNKQIKDSPKPKTEPDEETLAFYNEYTIEDINWQEQIDEKMGFLNQLKEL